jgi:hypothetical protein
MWHDNMLLSTALLYHMDLVDLDVLELFQLFLAHPEEDVEDYLPKILNILSPAKAVLLLGLCMYITFTLCCDSRSCIGPGS